MNTTYKVTKWAIILIVLLIASEKQTLYGQDALSYKRDSSSIVFNFRFNKSSLDSSYICNKESLKLVDEIFKDDSIVSKICSIKIVAASSPEGDENYNNILALKRAQTIKHYIISKYPEQRELKIEVTSIGENWVELRDRVKTGAEIESKNRVIEIINDNISSSKKKNLIKQINNGELWRYMQRSYFKYMRFGVASIVYYKRSDSLLRVLTSNIDPIAITKKREIHLPPLPIQKKRIDKISLFAVKTNLLADVITLANIEVEVPIKERWSVSAEWIFPWWKNSNSNLTMQIIYGQGAVKYWLGDRGRYEVMTGWSIGLYGGGGKYDIQPFKNNGKQGDLFSVGVQGGYAHKIAKNFRMEYSLGLGFMRTRYRKYEIVLDTPYGDIKSLNYPWEVKQLDWFGPTNIKVSLVWIFNYKIDKR